MNVIPIECHPDRIEGPYGLPEVTAEVGQAETKVPRFARDDKQF
jgi:hypothetical protein